MLDETAFGILCGSEGAALYLSVVDVLRFCDARCVLDRIEAGCDGKDSDQDQEYDLQCHKSV